LKLKVPSEAVVVVVIAAGSGGAPPEGGLDGEPEDGGCDPPDEPVDAGAGGAPRRATVMPLTVTPDAPVMAPDMLYVAVLTAAAVKLTPIRLAVVMVTTLAQGVNV